ncbi:hypothetical protein GUITHDRAFT_113076 [Guillardia theta CCMP2712]|uniref:Uncharacterized protein n=1 Tax=Guillardia theta (strain CCMP2712) TaxID=905079 RepID=L1IY64_GUITC|nr:hypothetical protein GUITHDRAFT_113076 [Guillardia theta CCMP2712]EKX40809.1 hypothetical protein GUITHDRAFT_113076 [Guillardia theta CCMP2712]|eukprot:XP_005827789.1 hypothetical protein GUITHDRAFT_113076 [Guillardia theta CCMP2712]
MQDDVRGQDSSMADAQGTMKGHRTAESTQKVYRYKVLRLVNMMKRKAKEGKKEAYRDLLDEGGNVRLPLTWTCVKETFEHLMTSKSMSRGRKRKRKAGEEEGNSSESSDSAAGGAGQAQAGGDAPAANQKLLSIGSVQGYKSALKHYYMERNVSFTAVGVEETGKTLDQNLDDMIQKHAESIGGARAEQVRAQEGNSVLQVKGYVAICKEMIAWRPKEKNREHGATGLFGYAAATFLWNCCCRSETLDELHMEHFDWRNDSLVLTIVKSKNDDAGNSVDMISQQVRHVFAAPHQPHTCPILALALYTIAQPRGYGNSTKFFPGNDQKQRFSKVLQRVLSCMDGGDSKDFGAQSFRKGSVAHLLSIPGGPSEPSVLIRGSWKVGNSRDGYITEAGSNDQYCGRILAGNDVMSDSFDNLPPHFSEKGLEKVRGVGLHKFVHGYESFPDSFKRCVPVFLANIVYHIDTLQEWFGTDHILWGAPMFGLQGTRTMEYLRSLRAEIVAGSMRCEDCGMKSTGIPPYYHVLAENRRFRKEIVEVQNQLHYALNQLPDKILDQVAEKIKGRANEHLPLDDLESLKADVRESIKIAMRGHDTCDSNSNRRVEDNIASTVGDPGGHDSQSSMQGDVFVWDDGQVHMVPQDYKFAQKVDCKNVWQRWHVGEHLVENGVRKSIGPLKQLKPSDLGNRNMRKNVSKARKVMEKLEKMAREGGELEEGQEVTIDNYQSCFDVAYKKIVEDIYGPDAWEESRCKKKYQDLSYITVYKYIRKISGEAESGDESAQEDPEEAHDRTSAGGE